MAGHLHLQKRFNSTQARWELLLSLWSRGVEGCMDTYGLKSREQFARFIAKLVKQGEFKPLSPLAGISGGKKLMVLEQHQDTILDCEGLLGKDITKCIFNLSGITLENLKTRTPRQTRNQAKYDGRVDHLEVRLEDIASQVHECKREIEELKSIFQKFVESTSNQICRTFLIPLLRNVLNFEGNLPEKIDELDIDRLLEAALAKEQHTD